MIDTSLGFTLTREIDATPQQVWAAWTDPDLAAQWWPDTARETVAIDARVGGRYTYTIGSAGDASAEQYPTGGVYREVVEPERLVFTWGHPDGDPDETPVVTVTVKDLGELTRLTFELRGVDGSKGDGYFYDGWEGTLDSLVNLLGQNVVHG